MQGPAQIASEWLFEAQTGDTPQRILQTRLQAYLNRRFLGPEDETAWTACVLAFVSVCSHDYGIGALIVDHHGHPNGAPRGYPHGAGPLALN